MRLMREKQGYMRKGMALRDAFGNGHPNMARNSIALDSLGPAFASFDQGPSYTMSDNILNSITHN